LKSKTHWDAQRAIRRKMKPEKKPKSAKGKKEKKRGERSHKLDVGRSGREDYKGV